MLVKTYEQPEEIEIKISEEDFKFFKILLSERYHKLLNKILEGKEDEIDKPMYKKIESLQKKYNG